MIIRNLQGDDEINMAATCAMGATLNALVSDNIIARDVANLFAQTHVCVAVTHASFWEEIRKLIGLTNNNNVAYVVMEAKP